MRLSHETFNLYLIFFGLWCVLIGYLIFRSTFMPRVLGILLAIDGIGWMTFLVPPFASSIFVLIAVASAAAEISLQLWLVIFGINSQKWYEQAARSDLAALHLREQAAHVLAQRAVAVER